MSQKDGVDSLWVYALAVYQRAEVARCCLALQDRFSADVNLLLSAGWLAGQGRLWRRDEVAALVDSCADWRCRCLLPVRSVRRYLGDRRNDNPALARLYERGKALELEAERYQLELIEAALQTVADTDTIPAGDRLAANLDQYLRLLPADFTLLRPERDALVAALSGDG